MSMWNELAEELLVDAASLVTETKEEAQERVQGARDQAEESARKLAAMVAADEPGIDEAVIVERDILALSLAVSSAELEYVTYHRILNRLEGGLLMLARVIARVA